MMNLQYLLSCVKNYRFNSLLVKNMILILLLVMLPLNCLCLFLYKTTSQSTRQDVFNSNLHLIQSIQRMMDNNLYELELLAINTSLQDDIRDYMTFPPDENTITPAQLAINQYIKNFTFTHNTLDSIYIYCEKNHTILSSYQTTSLQTFDDLNWFDAYTAAQGDQAFFLLRARNGNYPFFLSIIKPIYLSDNAPAGCVVVNIDIQKLAYSFNNTDQASKYALQIIDADTRVIYSDTDSFITKSIDETGLDSQLVDIPANTTKMIRSGGEDLIVSVMQSSHYSWRYYSVSPRKHYSDQFNALISIMLWLVVLSVLFSAAIALYISLRTFQPLHHILSLIDNPTQAIGVSHSDTPKNETVYILDRISAIFQSNQDLKEELSARMILLKRIQTVALQSQMNPHFLFNTLDIINWLAIDIGGPENKASYGIHLLSDMLKSNIDTENYLICLSEEIAYTKKYLEIVALQHRQQLHVEWQIDDAALSCMVPRLTLQPIVENAFSHGLKPKQGEKRITITTRRTKKLLTLEITDTGIGIAEDQLSKINQQLSENTTFFKKGIGLKNINQRIKLIYGDVFGIELKSKPGCGTTVIIKLLAT